MLLNLIINILAVIGVLTIILIVLALWVFVSDESNYEYPLIIDFEDMERTIPSTTKKESTTT